MENENSILVVGAGPVGLMMAAELRRHGAACRLIDRLPAASPHCKALGVTPRTLEAWDDLGIVQPMLSAGVGFKGAINLASGEVSAQEKIGIAIPDGAYGFIALAQYEVERVLTDHLHSLGGHVERGTELVGLEQTDASVQAKLKHADGATEALACQYLVGCDGGRSAVRHALGVPFEGEHYEQTFLLADIEIDGPLERGYAYRIARIEGGKPVSGGACIPIPGNPKRYRFSTVAPEAMIPPKLASAGQQVQGIADIGPRLEQVQELLGWFFPDMRASNMRWSAFYRISHRLAAKYRVGRAFLAGDAAHLHPPIGGQGLNTGVQDAYNVAWKMALDVRVLAAASLLDSYEAERRLIGQQLVERTTQRMNRMMEGQADPEEPRRDDSQLFVNYRSSPIVRNDLPQSIDKTFGPIAGDRAPDVTGLRRALVRHDLRLFDLLRGPHFTLLLYTSDANTSDDCEKFAAIAEALKQKCAGRIQTYAVIHPDCVPPEIESLPMVIDNRNQFAQTYATHSGGGLLIRPDGYLGYRAEPMLIEKLREYLARLFA